MAIDASTLPGEFLREIRALLGEETGAFLHALEEDSVHALRINSLKPGAFAAAEPWAESPVPWEPLGRYVKQEARPGAAIEHAAGAYYMQDASAMAAVAALAPQPVFRAFDARGRVLVSFALFARHSPHAQPHGEIRQHVDELNTQPNPHLQ